MVMAGFWLLPETTCLTGSWKVEGSICLVSSSLIISLMLISSVLNSNSPSMLYVSLASSILLSPAVARASSMSSDAAVTIPCVNSLISQDTESSTGYSEKLSVYVCTNLSAYDIALSL